MYLFVLKTVQWAFEFVVDKQFQVFQGKLWVMTNMRADSRTLKVMFRTWNLSKQRETLIPQGQGLCSVCVLRTKHLLKACAHWRKTRIEIEELVPNLSKEYIHCFPGIQNMACLTVNTILVLNQERRGSSFHCTASVSSQAPMHVPSCNICRSWTFHSGKHAGLLASQKESKKGKSICTHDL